MLCEGQSHVFLSLPSGELRTLPLDSDFQAEFLPQDGGPHTFQCGNETKTIPVPPHARADSGAYSNGENLFIVAGMAAAFIAALFSAAKFFIRPCTSFSKSESNGRMKLCLRAGENLQDVRITDPQGGEGGLPLELSIPYLPAGKEWVWERECSPGEPQLPARLSAKYPKGEISLISQVDGGMVQAQAADGDGAAVKRKLKRAD